MIPHQVISRAVSIAVYLTRVLPSTFFVVKSVCTHAGLQHPSLTEVTDKMFTTANIPEARSTRPCLTFVVKQGLKSMTTQTWSSLLFPFVHSTAISASD